MPGRGRHDAGTVAVVDYGMGNLRSVSQAVHARSAGLAASRSSSRPEARRRAGGRPGRAAGPRRHARLHARAATNPGCRSCCAATPPSEQAADGGLRRHADAALDAATKGPTDCLGLFAGRRDEASDLDGSSCSRTEAASRFRRWAGTSVFQARSHPDLGTACRTRSYFYFVHSFLCAAGLDAEHSVGETDYGDALYLSALARDNIFATQFHPEKSADHGLALYRNFPAMEASMNRCGRQSSRHRFPHSNFNLTLHGHAADSRDRPQRR